MKDSGTKATRQSLTERNTAIRRGFEAVTIHKNAKQKENSIDAKPIQIERKRASFFIRNSQLLEPLMTDSKASYLTRLKKQKVESFVTPKEKFTAQPEQVKGGVMKEYQLEGLAFLIWLNMNGLNGVLGDEMGLGKLDNNTDRSNTQRSRNET
jgi:SNF2 family DNA or RNA helicase